MQLRSKWLVPYSSQPWGHPAAWHLGEWTGNTIRGCSGNTHISKGDLCINPSIHSQSPIHPYPPFHPSIHPSILSTGSLRVLLSAATMTYRQICCEHMYRLHKTCIKPGVRIDRFRSRRTQYVLVAQSIMSLQGRTFASRAAYNLANIVMRPYKADNAVPVCKWMSVGSPKSWSNLQFSGAREGVLSISKAAKCGCKTNVWMWASLIGLQGLECAPCVVIWAPLAYLHEMVIRSLVKWNMGFFRLTRLIFRSR